MNKLAWLRAVLGTLALGCSLCGVTADARVTGDPVQVDGGLVEGTWGRNSVTKAYLGIPYAAPPVGNLRWRAPAPVVPWDGVRKATSLPPSCIQGARAPGSVSIEVYGNRDLPMSEDCLYLNVWVPSDIAANDRLPVMFWMHGGGNTSGSGSKPEFNGEVLASQGMIVVTLNYRLNLFGFFAHPGLSAESPQHTSGNYGMLDQVAALQWLRRNIAHFGGDPDKVMIIGQSAGSGAVNQHMVSPLSRGLFQRGVAMSGPVSFNGNSRTLQQAESDGTRFANKISASLADLRAIKPDVLYSIYGDIGINFGPIVDGYFMPKPVGELWQAGNTAKVPYMTGWSSHELFEQVYDRTLDEYKRLATQRVGEDRLAQLLTLYGVKDDASALEARIGLNRDANFGLNTWRTARASSANGDPTFVYYWARPTQAWPGQSFAENSPASLLGAYHGSQVPYVFGTLDLLDRELKPIDRQLSAQWQRYLINFARTGNPNGNGQPTWPAYSAANQVALTMAERTSAGPVPNRDKMEFFETLNAPQAPRTGTSFVNGR